MSACANLADATDQAGQTGVRYSYLPRPIGDAAANPWETIMGNGIDVMQFVGVGSDRQLWGTTRETATGDWAVGDPTVYVQPPGCAGQFQDVDTAGVGNGECEIVAIGDDGKLYHTLRDGDGNWQAAGMGAIATQTAGGPAAFVGVGTAGDGQGGLNVVGVGSDGHLWHTARDNNGKWFATFDDLADRNTGGPGSYTAVAAAGAGGPTEVVAVGSDGHLWHTIRFASNLW